MCVEASPKKAGCGCDGHGLAKTVALTPHTLRTITFGETPAAKCACSGHACPRHYLAITGFMLGGFLILHLALNSLALWPNTFQAAVGWNHSFGGLLPVFEIALIFVPLSVHLAFGLRTLKREKLRIGVEKHHHGSDLRQWLQRLTAVILLLFLSFHVAVMQRWFGGRFNPGQAFNSASQAVWHFWRGEPTGSFPNLLIAQFYLVGLAAAAFHAANGLATGAEVLGWVRPPAAQNRLRRISICIALLLLLAGMAAWYALAAK